MKIYSIFDSIDGEVNFWGQGTQTTFVRLAGCSFGCPFCDTTYATGKNKGVEMSVEEVFDEIRDRGNYKITITGGEPLEQKDELMKLLELLKKDHKVTLETNGAHAINSVPWEVPIVMDYKVKNPEKMILGNFDELQEEDFIKFVIENKKDYIHAKEVVKKNPTQARIFFSPVHGVLEPKTLLKWLKKDKLHHVGLNVQLHKVLDLKEDK